MASAEIVQLTQEFVQLAGYSAHSVDIHTDPLFPDTVIIHITIPELDDLHDQQNELIQAFLHILQRSIEKRVGTTPDQKYHLDINHFYEIQRKELQNKALLCAEQVRENRLSQALEPMTAYERLIIHSLFADVTDIKTQSVGEEPQRLIMLHYMDNLTN